MVERKKDSLRSGRYRHLRRIAHRLLDSFAGDRQNDRRDRSGGGEKHVTQVGHDTSKEKKDPTEHTVRSQTLRERAISRRQALKRIAKGSIVLGGALIPTLSPKRSVAQYYDYYDYGDYYDYSDSYYDYGDYSDYYDYSDSYYDYGDYSDYYDYSDSYYDYGDYSDYYDYGDSYYDYGDYSDYYDYGDSYYDYGDSYYDYGDSYYDYYDYGDYS